MTREQMAKGLFTAAMLSALALGATQALAQPHGSMAAANTCDAWDCLQTCIELGYDRGRCTYPGFGDCVCYNF